MTDISRRQFLQQTAVTAGGIALLGGAALSADNVQPQPGGPSERIRIATIGCGGMGNAHLSALLKLKEDGYPVDIVAVCDVYQPRLDAAAAKTGGTPYKDYRKLLERKDIDAISIATPDHWHAPLTIAAADAGKDVYCEKPMTYWKDLGDAKKVVEAIARNKRVMQVGTQAMSGSIWAQVNDRIKAGAVGNLIHAQASDLRSGYWGCYDPKADDGQADPTKNLDWDMWLGSAKKRPYEPGRFFAFRSFWDYSGGCGTDFLPHIMTPLVRSMGLTFPQRVTGSGGLYQHKDGREIPDIFTITAEYPDGPSLLLVASLATDAGLPMMIRGHKGVVSFGGPGAIINPTGTPSNETKKEEISATRGESLEEHFRDFLDCTRTRQKPRSNELLGYYVMTTLHMAVHSYRKGKSMSFDPKTEKAKFI